MSGALTYFYSAYGDTPPLAVPSAVTVTSIVSGIRALTVSFTPCPEPYPGHPRITYKAVANPGNVQVTGTGSPITITGLQNSTDYTVTVFAISSAGTSATNHYATTVSPVVHIADVPGAPTLVSVTPTGTTITSINITAPSSNGGAPIQNYTMKAVSADQLHVITHTVGIGTTTGLQNFHTGEEYTFTVYANNVVGRSVASNPIVIQMPRVPTITSLSISPGIGSLNVTVNANSYGYPVLISYVNIQGVGMRLCVNGQVDFRGLALGTVYNVQGYASNKWGGSSWSIAVQATTGGQYGAVGAPTVTLTGKTASNNLQIAIAANNSDPASLGIAGSLHYRITCSDGSVFDNRNAGTQWVFPATGYGTTAYGSTGTANVNYPPKGVPLTFYVEMWSTYWGWSPATENITFTPTRRPNAVYQVNVTSVDMTTIAVSWVPPSDDGGSPLQYYTVRLYKLYYPNHGSSFTEQWVNQPEHTRNVGLNVNNLTYEGLTPGTSYAVFVTATSAVGESPIASGSCADRYNDNFACYIDSTALTTLNSSVYSTYCGVHGWMGAPYQYAYLTDVTSTNVTRTKNIPYTAPTLLNAYSGTTNRVEQISFKVRKGVLQYGSDPIVAKCVSSAAYFPNAQESVVSDAIDSYSLQDSSGNVLWEGFVADNTEVNIAATNGVNYSLHLTAHNYWGWSPFSTYVSYLPIGRPRAPQIIGVYPYTASRFLTIFYTLDPAATGDGNGYAISSCAITSSIDGGTTLVQHGNNGLSKVTQAIADKFNARWGTGFTTDHYYTTVSYLTDGQYYSVALRSYNSAGLSDYVWSGGTPGTVPSSIRNMLATNTGVGTINWSWVVPSSNGGYEITGYECFLYCNADPRYPYGGGPDGTPSRNFYTTATNFEIGDLLAYKTYYLYVRAVNQCGTSTGWVNAYKATWNVPDSPRYLTSVPGNYVAGTSDGQINFRWYSNHYGTDWNNVYAYGTPVDWIEIADYYTGELLWQGLPELNVPYGVGGQTNGMRRYLKGRAHNAVGWSAWNGLVWSEYPYGKPNTPDGFFVTQSGNYMYMHFTPHSGSVQTSSPTVPNSGWNGLAGGYRVYTSTGVMFNTNNNSSYYPGNSLKGNNLGFTLVAYNTAGEGASTYTECYFP